MLGFWAAVSIVTGNMVGSGVFLLPASLAPYRRAQPRRVDRVRGGRHRAGARVRAARAAAPGRRGTVRLHAAGVRGRPRFSRRVGILVVDRRHARGAGGCGCRLSRSLHPGDRPHAPGGRGAGRRDCLDRDRVQRRGRRRRGTRADRHDGPEAPSTRRRRRRRHFLLSIGRVHPPRHDDDPNGRSADLGHDAHALGVPRPRVRDDPGRKRPESGSHYPARHDCRHRPRRGGLHRVDDRRHEPGRERRAGFFDGSIRRRRAPAARRGGRPDRGHRRRDLVPRGAERLGAHGRPAADGGGGRRAVSAAVRAALVERHACARDGRRGRAGFCARRVELLARPGRSVHVHHSSLHPRDARAVRLLLARGVAAAAAAILRRRGRGQHLRVRVRDVRHRWRGRRHRVLRIPVTDGRAARVCVGQACIRLT